MFENPGDKLKVVAIVSFCFQIIGAIVTFFVCAFSEQYFAGILSGVSLFISAWVSTIALLALASACNNAEIAADRATDALILIKKLVPVEEQKSNMWNNSKPKSSSATTSANGWKCACGREHASYVTSCICGKNKRDMV